MKSSKKIKVDAELWHSIIEGAETAGMEIVRWSQKLEDVKKAYLLLTAAHDQATLVNADLIRMQVNVGNFASDMQAEVDDLKNSLKMAEMSRDLWRSRAQELGDKNEQA